MVGQSMLVSVSGDSTKSIDFSDKLVFNLQVLLSMLPSPLSSTKVAQWAAGSVVLMLLNWVIYFPIRMKINSCGETF